MSRLTGLGTLVALLTGFCVTRFSLEAQTATSTVHASVVWVSNRDDLQNAVRQLESGQTIMIRSGTYHLSQSLLIGPRRPLTNITVRGETDDPADVILLGGGMENANHGGVLSGIGVYDAQNVTIAYLSVGEVFYHPIMLDCNAGADRIHIHHTRLFNAGKQFIKSNSGRDRWVSDSIVEHSTMEYTERPPLLDRGGGTGYTNGVDVHTGRNWVIRHNVFRNFHTPDSADNLWNPAVLVWNHSEGTIVENNIFIDTDRAIAFGLEKREAGHDHKGGIIRKNIVYLTPGLFSAPRREGADAPIVVWDSPETQVYGNAVVTNGNTPKSIEVRWGTGVLIQQNWIDAPLGKRGAGSYLAKGNYLAKRSVSDENRPPE